MLFSRSSYCDVVEHSEYPLFPQQHIPPKYDCKLNNDSDTCACLDAESVHVGDDPQYLCHVINIDQEGANERPTPSGAVNHGELCAAQQELSMHGHPHSSDNNTGLTARESSSPCCLCRPGPVCIKQFIRV